MKLEQNSYKNEILSTVQFY